MSMTRGTTALLGILVLATASVAPVTRLWAQLPAVDSVFGSDPAFHVAPGGRRDLKEEARRQGSVDPRTRAVLVYSYLAAPGEVFRYYLGRLPGRAAPPPDSTGVAPGGSTPTTYELVFHSFEDECADPPTTATGDSGAASACRRWRRGKDKERAISNSLVMWEPGHWFQDATFTWYHRGMRGELRRQQVEIRDVGLSDSWKNYSPKVLLIFESTVIESPAP